MKTAHTHPCADCHDPTPCDGTWVRNYDGFPEALCDQYHLPYGETAPIYCESCGLERQEARNGRRRREHQA